MLEKMGLPAKPSLRGNNWVVDASHCQSCSSPFSFINRKHHCRRCGGLFCNTCTQHRMILRGQGDSPVRICEPCKKLEEAARFELRYGHKNRAGKGSSKSTSRSVNEVLDHILTNDGKESGKDGKGLDEDTNLLGTAPNDNSVGDSNEMDNLNPDELRQQAIEEKKQYKILKGDGKSAEALKAFKKSRELEKQAAALELQLRKNRRKALASSSTADAHSKEEASPETITREKSIPQKGKEKDDLTSELRELGWSDNDIHDIDKKSAPMSLEGELLNLVGRDSEKGGQSKSSSGLDKSQVIALKKKALTLKREGKLAEAKEELKRAKILEKQIEEQEFLADADESDDELSALMRSLDSEGKKGISTGFDLDVGFDMNNISDFGGDIGFDGNFEVTDDDLLDPDMAATLQSLGWDEEPNQPDDSVPQLNSVKKEELVGEILKLKKEALSQKRSGNTSEAMSLLKKAKILEKDLDTLADVNMSQPESVLINQMDRKFAPKTKITIQKELLSLKKKAFALKKEGKFDEADNELKKGKVLEQQLEELDSNTSNVRSPMNVNYKTSEPMGMNFDLSSVLALGDEDVDLTDQDEDDPAYLSVLQNLGWQDEDNLENKDTNTTSVSVTVKKQRSKAEIQRELLGLKRKALALKRQGKGTEADEVLATAKVLEEELSEVEMPKQGQVVDFSETMVVEKVETEVTQPEVTEVIEKGSQQTPLKRTAESSDASEKRRPVHLTPLDNDVSPNVSPENQNSPVQQEILSHKRKALVFKREGKLAEAREELRKAKLLQKNLQEDKPQNPMEVNDSTVSSTVKENSPPTLTISEEKSPPHLTTKPMSSSDRYKLQRECLAHKRTAMKLRREGRTEEADMELELAKKLESQLEEANPTPATSAGGLADMAGIEDLFDPQLLSALQSIGLQDANVVSNAPVKEEASTSSSSSSNVSNQERLELESQIKAEKLKALHLKRAGKQAEALTALRHAKQMEKKLNSLQL